MRDEFHTHGILRIFDPTNRPTDQPTNRPTDQPVTFDVTIPVLNEEETLEQQVKKVHAFLSEHFPTAGQWRIVIADNGSTDQTGAIALQLEQNLPGVHWLRLPEKGVGLALKTSWLASEADMVGYMDLDLATDLRHFIQAYNAIATEGYDVVYGSRLHKKSRVIGRTLKREITSRAFNQKLVPTLGFVRFFSMEKGLPQK